MSICVCARGKKVDLTALLFHEYEAPELKNHNFQAQGTGKLDSSFQIIKSY